MRALGPFTVLVLALAAVALLPGGRAAGPTYVQGEVFGVWTADASPYVVIADAFVPTGRTLDVGPGVEVRFTAATGLWVKGSLVVHGQDLLPASFTANRSTTPGSWRGIVVEGSASMSMASVTYAKTAIDVAGGLLTGERIAASHSAIGLLVNRTAASLTGLSVSFNEATAIEVRGSTLALTRPEIASNAWGLTLQGATVSIENGTIAGSAIGDLELTLSSATLLNTPSSGVFQFHDFESSVTERWYTHAAVQDRFGSPVPSASVTAAGGALPGPVTHVADADGVARWFDLMGRTSSASGPTAYSYTITASAYGSSASLSVSPTSETLVSVALPDDVTAPAADAGPDLTVPEDQPVTLDASGSRDNSPTFPAGAGFEWRIPTEGGGTVVLTGALVSHVFPTPGAYAVILSVSDAAGNTGQDLALVAVQDLTPPVAGLSVRPEAYEGESVVLDASPSTDNNPAFAESGNFTWTLEFAGATRTLYGRTVAFSEWWGTGDYRVTLAVRDGGGNSDTAARTIRISPRPISEIAWLAAALGAWFAGLGIWGTERGRMAFMSLFVLPLFTRMKKEEVLDQFTRGQIYGYIVVHPGDSYVDIKRNLQLNNGTLTHHLNVLERDALIVSKNVGTRKLFYAKGTRVPEDGGGMHEVQQQIMKHLREAGGLPVNDIAGSIGISRQLAIYHLRDLSRRGFVRIERRAFRIVAFAEDPPPPPPP